MKMKRDFEKVYCIFLISFFLCRINAFSVVSPVLEHPAYFINSQCITLFYCTNKKSPHALLHHE